MRYNNHYIHYLNKKYEYKLIKNYTKAIIPPVANVFVKLIKSTN